MSLPVVLMTGALTGIGRATAVAFSHDGARVVVSGRHDDEGQKLATELRELGSQAETGILDATETQRCRTIYTRRHCQKFPVLCQL